MRILMVEDDAGIAEGLRANLRQHGHAVDWCGTLAAAWNALTTEGFDAVLLDLGLPDGDGTSLLQRLRNAPADSTRPDPATPVIILTARDGVHDRIGGLDLGADDYLAKPFDAQELQARLRALLRRAAGRANPLIQYRELVVDPALHQVRLAGQPVELPPRAFTILLILLEARGRVLSRQQLEERLYNFDSLVESNAVEVHIHHLRKKLGADYIHTMRGVGYFMPQV
ncbi:MAG: response regulator transcription factor [Comamonas sp.]